MSHHLDDSRLENHEIGIPTDAEHRRVKGGASVGI